MTCMKSKPLLAALLAILCSCAGTVAFREPAAFPEREIAELAAQIEDVVLNTTLDGPVIPDTDETSGVADIDPIGAVVGTDEIRRRTPALAKLNVDNEIMLTAIRGRMLRRPAVMEFERNGCVGENGRALLQYLRTDWCPNDPDMRSRAGFAVLTENRDRRAIYNQIVEANGLSGSAHDRIREIFAEEIHKKAWAGTPLELPDGTWKRR